MKQLKYFALAALVALAACDEGDGADGSVTGTISGTVTVENAGLAGVTVRLGASGPTATTSATGAYSFSDVAAGAYTVELPTVAADLVFAAGTQKAAVIATNGEVVTVNFAGTYIRSQSLSVGVVGPTGAIPNVNVALSGAGSASTPTNSLGVANFNGLRTGTYTVTISGFDATNLSFPATSQQVVLALNESKTLTFTATAIATATVRGSLFLDENEKNDNFDSTEDRLKVANVGIQLEGGTVNNNIVTQTDANGDFTFSNLPAGTYRVTILNATGAGIDPDIPTNVAFGGTTTSQLVSVSVGSVSPAVNFPFDITRQTIKVYAFLGSDSDALPAATPIPNYQLSLYDTDLNANAGGATGRLGQVNTNVGGESVFRFNRSLDLGPNGQVDNIVFARATGTLPPNYVLNGETIIEIKYSPKDSLTVSPDSFDALNNLVVIGVDVREIDADTLAGWTAYVYDNRDSVTAVTFSGNTDANGRALFTVQPTTQGLPDTLWVKLASTQPGANGHGFTQTPVAGRGTTHGSYLRYIWNGTVLASDTVIVGTSTVKYTDSDVSVRVHREQDDSTGVMPTYTLGDGLISVDLTNVELYSIAANGTRTSFAGPGAPSAVTGMVTWANVPVNANYEVRGRVTNTGYTMLNDTVIAAAIDGSDQTAFVEPLLGSAGSSTFAIKSNSNMISGSIVAADGTPVATRRVRVQAGPGNIQGTKDTTVVTSGAGAFTTLGNLLEGPYTVTAADSTDVWGYSIVLLTTSTPTSGAADNSAANVAPRDIQGSSINSVANFLGDRLDTQIQGVIVNDRDGDFNTVDPTEGLAGAEVKLYKDNSGAPTVSNDSLVATTTTDAAGSFSFTGLREGRYIVRPTPGTPAGQTTVILRADINGDTAIVRTAAAAAAAGTGNPDATLGAPGTYGRVVGITSGFTAALPLPAWNYGASNLNLVAGAALHRQPHFTFLYGNGVATGVVTKTGANVSGMTISAVRCATSTGYTSPPTIPIGGGTCTPTGAATNVVTNAQGVFTFENLREGVWLLTANPATAGLPDAVTTGLWVILGSADVETGNFVFP